MKTKELSFFETLKLKLNRNPTHKELMEEIERYEDEFEKWLLRPIIKKDNENE